MKKNSIDKIWESHLVAQQPGHPAIFAIDCMLLHEVTSAQAFQTLADRGIPVFQPAHCIATLDHSIPTDQNRKVIKDLAAKKQVQQLRDNAAQHQIKLYDFDSQYQGIVHVIGPELGATQPGMTIVCGDSHTSTHGAFGALAFGIGTSTVGHVLASGCLLLQKPKVMEVIFDGHFQAGVGAKDGIMKLIAEIGIGGATGYVLEYKGVAIDAMSMEQRMTVCNMSIECGARAGLINPDQTTFDYIKGRPYAPDERDWQKAVSYWKTFQSDPGCGYDRNIIINAAALAPMVTWGTNPGQAVEITKEIPRLEELNAVDRHMAEQALAYVGLKPGQRVSGTKIDWAFVGSCTNGRIEDLREVAKVLQDRKVHPQVTMYIVPGSERVFAAAGAELRQPGCSMCIAMNPDKVPAGARCISTTNRNFVGRQGPGSITHLASPATVAASAVTGEITSVNDL